MPLPFIMTLFYEDLLAQSIVLHLSLKQDLSLEELSSTFDAYVAEAHRLRSLIEEDKSKLNISILIGLETDYITSLDLDELAKLLERHGDSIEYIIGSVHHLHEFPLDYGKELFDDAAATAARLKPTPASSVPPTAPDLQPLISDYLDQQYTVLTRFHPEIIGHFDLFRLYYPNYSLSPGTTPEVWEKMKRNIQYAIEYGALFELNAAAFRKGWEQAYPGKEIAEVSSAELNFVARLMLY